MHRRGLRGRGNLFERSPYNTPAAAAQMVPPAERREAEREREREGRRPNAFLGLSLNDGTILFLALLRYVFRHI